MLTGEANSNEVNSLNDEIYCSFDNILRDQQDESDSFDNKFDESL